MTMTMTEAEWVRLNVLPPMRRHPDGIDELRMCFCQAEPSDWLGGVIEPAARLWNRDGRALSYPDQGSLVQIWLPDRICRRRWARPTTTSQASLTGPSPALRPDDAEEQLALWDAA